MGGGHDGLEVGGDFGGESHCCKMVRWWEKVGGRGWLLTSLAWKEFLEEDLHGIEPIKDRRLAARRDTLAVKPSAEIPEADLIEIM